MTRWIVERYRGFNKDDGYHIGWHVRGNPQAPCGEWFATWREAQDYADRAARTVEVALPRDASLAGEWKLTRVFSGSDLASIWVESNGKWDNYAFIQPEHLQPLALALLAHHYKQEVQP